MAGAGQSDPLRELWLRTRGVLAPFGIQVDGEHLALWRDQAKHGQGPLRWAERGQREAVEELVALLRLFTETRDAQAGKGDVHAGDC